MAEHGFTRGPWGIEQTRDMLWVGPIRADGHKVDEVVVGLTIDSQLTHAAALKQLYNARLIAASPTLLEAAIAVSAAAVKRAAWGRDNVPAMREEQRALADLRAAITLATGKDA